MRELLVKNTKHREVSAPRKILRDNRKCSGCHVWHSNKAHKLHATFTVIDGVKVEADIPSRTESCKNPDGSPE